MYNLFLYICAYKMHVTCWFREQFNLCREMLGIFKIVKYVCVYINIT